MQLTIGTDDEKFICVEIDGEEDVDSLKAILTVETGVPMHDQRIVFQGNTLSDQDKLSGKGVKDGDLLLMHQAPSTPQVGQGTPDIRELIQRVQGNPAQMAALEANNPGLAEAFRSGDVERVTAAIYQNDQKQRQIEEEERKLLADPFNVEAQKKIEELIREKNVEENFLQAVEHTPEVFGSVTMLYVNMEVNGNPVQAFVDSGAQMTIMTAPFAEKCGLMRLVDKRYAGFAVGVGRSKIIGRVHQCPLKVRGSYVTSSVTILEQKTGPQFIFGLDNLSRHQCCIDLKNNALKFATCNEELPFLSEHEITEKNAFDLDPSTEEVPGSTSAGEAPGSSDPTPQPVTTQVSPEVESKVLRLMDLGFPREKCLAALNAAQGNENAAASILFGGLF